MWQDLILAPDPLEKAQGRIKAEVLELIEALKQEGRF